MKEKVKAVKFTMFLCLGVLCTFAICTQAPAAQLWPMQVGEWMHLHKQSLDPPNNDWTVYMNVMGQVTQDGKQYYIVDEYNYSGEGDLSEFYVRSTDTQIWIYTPSGAFLAFETGQPGTSWTYPNPNDNGASTIHKTLVKTESITVPYGGPYTAYEYEHHAVYQDGSKSASCYEWIVPGLGYVQERDEWGENTLAKLTVTGIDFLCPGTLCLGSGWLYSSFFGFFNVLMNPWIYHQTLGWLYPLGTSTDSIWFYDPQWDGTGGWWWTSSSLFPCIYSTAEKEWLYFDAADSTPGVRWFFTSAGQASTH